MCGVLALLFIAVPALEIFLLIRVGMEIGALPTLGLIVATGVIGAVLARHQGLAALRKVAWALATGQSVARAAVEAALVVAAGALLLAPGLVTDAFGLWLLLPLGRRRVADWLVRRYAGRAMRVVVPGQDRPDDHGPPPPGVIDV